MDGLTRPTIILGMSALAPESNRNQYTPISKNKKNRPEQPEPGDKGALNISAASTSRSLRADTW